ncbi:hypothetical protein JCM10449v2_002773 [Rhodotorula kratochvilovae]
MPRVTLFSAPAAVDEVATPLSSLESSVGPARVRMGEERAQAPSSGSKPYPRTRPAPKSEVDSFVLDRVPPPFPRDLVGRSSFERDSGTKCTAFQWRLYDLLLTIPPGTVATYGQLATLLDSSARAVGSALRNNPFAPFVPCHRVIASTLYIGGFGGEWIKAGAAAVKKGGKAPAGKEDEGRRTAEKVELLRREGVEFDAKGYLRSKAVLWDGKKKAVEVVELLDDSEEEKEAE